MLCDEPPTSDEDGMAIVPREMFFLCGPGDRRRRRSNGSARTFTQDFFAIGKRARLKVSDVSSRNAAERAPKTIQLTDAVAVAR